MLFRSFWTVWNERDRKFSGNCQREQPAMPLQSHALPLQGPMWRCLTCCRRLSSARKVQALRCPQSFKQRWKSLLRMRLQRHGQGLTACRPQQSIPASSQDLHVSRPRLVSRNTELLLRTVKSHDARSCYTESATSTMLARHSTIESGAKVVNQ